ncbi:MAG: hypothetical protein ACRDSK_00400 [Actinophytocola sp.]|jgi:hypothetical protein|uniref:hypothetical protein n=1 Tax=Actinophytocola sp. TaxID=1872138 RepID=UPI003D6AA26D
MSTTTIGILDSLFFDGAGAPTHADVSIDVLDSWTNSGRAPVSPTTISWCDGTATEAATLAVS